MGIVSDEELAQYKKRSIDIESSKQITNDAKNCKGNEKVIVRRKNGELSVVIGEYELFQSKNGFIPNSDADYPFPWYVSRKLTETTSEVGYGVFSCAMLKSKSYNVWKFCKDDIWKEFSFNNINPDTDTCESIATELVSRIRCVRAWVESLLEENESRLKKNDCAEISINIIQRHSLVDTKYTRFHTNRIWCALWGMEAPANDHMPDGSSANGAIITHRTSIDKRKQIIMRSLFELNFTSWEETNELIDVIKKYSKEEVQDDCAEVTL